MLVVRLLSVANGRFDGITEVILYDRSVLYLALELVSLCMCHCTQRPKGPAISTFPE